MDWRASKIGQGTSYNSAKNSKAGTPHAPRQVKWRSKKVESNKFMANRAFDRNIKSGFISEDI